MSYETRPPQGESDAATPAEVQRFFPAAALVDKIENRDALEDSELEAARVAAEGLLGVAGEAFTHGFGGRPIEGSPVSSRVIREPGSVARLIKYEPKGVDRQGNEYTYLAVDLRPVFDTQEGSVPGFGHTQQTVHILHGSNGTETTLSANYVPGMRTRGMTITTSAREAQVPATQQEVAAALEILQTEYNGFREQQQANQAAGWDAVVPPHLFPEPDNHA